MSTNTTTKTLIPTTVRAFVRPDLPTPTPHPDGGVFHILPMSQLELNRLAQKMVNVGYLEDRKGRTVFNQNGEAVPQLTKNDEQTIREAVLKCARITALAVPVYVNGEPEFEEVSTTPDDGATAVEQRVRQVPIELDSSDVECGSKHEKLEGRCTTMCTRKGKPPIQCARIIVGDYTDTAMSMMYQVLAGPYIVEVEEPSNSKATVAAAVSANSQEDEPAADASPSSAEGEESQAEKPAQNEAKKKKVFMLVAEWLVDKSTEYGHAKLQATLGN
jgi:hypothetical protein